MESQRTQIVPPKIEDLGDGTFYYNFDIVRSEKTEIMSNVVTIQFNYEQVRCNYPVDSQEIQAALNLEGYNHIVII